ncbi:MULTISPECIES: ComEA family DNA-binding protein [Vibrio]|uniref:Putative competence protein n=1 Tax=Vibrio halioticoli NBRC 102217 TaxID=1219072 RepID=V5F0A8_9VIBR|nr:MULTISPECIES: ComEA family DNA-binding protein [Vibrio]GAD88539.1 putative competence protein [Vibrio halioticoli NBRC 102217]
MTFANLKRYVSIVLLALLPFAVYSAEETKKADHYEGIEIEVNINTASSHELATLLLGVGEKKAQQIVAYREVHGEFKHADDLQQVKGIGQATVDKNRSRIRL